MNTIEQRVARETRAMTKKAVMLKAYAGHITWLQAAIILDYTPRHLRRIRARYEEYDFEGLRDGRAGGQRAKRTPQETIEKLLQLRRERYADFSVKHFHERITEKHGLGISYTWTKQVLFAHKLAERSDGRGKYRRKRERRPMVGMLVHQDASTHPWLADPPPQDLVLTLDDADGRALHGRFVPQEGTLPTMEALRHVLTRNGRFCEFYTDRGSHFCTTSVAGAGPDAEQHGQVARALKALGIRQILARSPEARGRSERAFKTIQGRLPQELRAAGIRTYEAANRYLTEVFIPDFNRRFTVRPAQPESAFTKLVGVDLSLLLSVQHDRIVAKDNTVHFEGLVLQLEPTRHRAHFVRCPVLVHELTDGTLAVTYQGRTLARFTRDGHPIRRPAAARSAA